MENGGLLTREQIFTAEDTPFEEIRVPAWGGTVKVKTMNADEGMDFSQLLARPEFKDHFREALVIACVVDENDAPIFTPEDLPALRKRNARAFTAVFNAAARLNGFSAEAVEAARKNS
jgi:hypothetical protein